MQSEVIPSTFNLKLFNELLYTVHTVLMMLCYN